MFALRCFVLPVSVWLSFLLAVSLGTADENLAEKKVALKKSDHGAGWERRA
jgi:hypothetical protein